MEIKPINREMPSDESAFPLIQTAIVACWLPLNAAFISALPEH
jgi:hypothetical protein